MSQHLVLGRQAILAISLALASSSLWAATGNVDVYGIVHVSIADVESGLSNSLFTETGTVFGGAHSRPLSHRVEPGQKAFWVAGDLGRDDHDSRDGSLGLAEVGGGHNLGSAQINFALGRTGTRQNLIVDGELETTGTYLMAEALIPMQGSLWGVLSGYYNWGDADIRRGYLDGGGLPDASFGSTDTHTWAVRARLEWDAAFRLGDAGFSPYGELSYMHASADAYTETGGSAPIAFVARDEDATDLRLGALLAKPLFGQTRLIGQLEGVHRFDANSKQDWLRAGLGMESEIAGGTAAMMLNATTEGEAANAWLALSYQKAF